MHNGKTYILVLQWCVFISLILFLKTPIIEKNQSSSLNVVTSEILVVLNG